MADESLAQLIADVKESLEREIRAVGDGIKRIETRLDAQAVRLERQGANWQTGRRWSARMDDWAEKTDGIIEDRNRQIDREIAELRARLDRLEGRPPAK